MGRVHAMSLLSLWLFGAAAPAAAVEVLTPDDVLIVEFTTTPPFFCGTPACTPNTLLLGLGPVEIPERFLEQSSRLSVDGSLLGTWVSTSFGLSTGTIGSLRSGAFVDASSPYTVSDPVVVDFQPILDGTSAGRFEVRIASGRIEIPDGFPFVSALLIEADSPNGGGLVQNDPVITSVRIEPDPLSGTFSVDSTAADPDALPGDGLCETASGACTLPAAVDESNALPDTNTILVPAGSYPGALSVSENVTIRGAGSGVTIVDAAGAGSVLTVSAGDVFLESLTLTGGDTPGSGGGIALLGGELDLFLVEVSGNSAAQNGGGIFQSGDTALFVLLSTLRQNTAGFSGGGIYSSTIFGDLAVESSEISDNQALAGDGGGVRTAGTGFVILSGVTLRGNSAVRTGGIAGAGIFVLIGDAYVFENTATDDAGGVSLTAADAFLSDSTLSDNESSNGVGGLQVAGGATVGVFSSTFSGNRGALGGGIGLESPFTVELSNATLTLNEADEGAGLRLSSVSGAGSLDLSNTVVAANVASGAGPDCLVVGALVTLQSLGHNLIGDGSACGFPIATGDQVGSSGAPLDPLLAPLAFTGGPTPTHAPLATSPLIDAGSPDPPETTAGSCDALDQRGDERPLDGDGDGVARCDIGAHEVRLLTVPAAGAWGTAILGLLLALAGYAFTRKSRG